ncbi:MAG TPA: glycosyltransferase family 1 protein [bacterium]|nr:glycosyltransferase family 1 protein [bacterium]
MKVDQSTTHLKIGIDARLYGPGHAGIGRYIQKLIEGLAAIDGKNEYFIFLDRAGFAVFEVPGANFKKVLADYPVYSVKEQLQLPYLLAKYKLDLVHFPHFNVPWFYRRPFVVTIHDLIISHYPDSRATTLPLVLYRLKLFFYRLTVKSAAKRAATIITVSQFSKDDIVNSLKIRPEKINITYEGYDPPLDRSSDCRQVLERFNLNHNYLLYVGSAYPHKNLDNLLHAFRYLIQDHDQLQLVLVGKETFFYQKLKQQIDDSGLTGRVILTGFVDDNDLACLYAGAEAYVFPSLIEGFGLPPLEAQSYDLPVVSSNATCLPEILGQSALFFDPNDPYEITQKIKTVLHDHLLREDLIRRGRENLKRYSWSVLARNTLNIYRQIFKGN